MRAAPMVAARRSAASDHLRRRSRRSSSNEAIPDPVPLAVPVRTTLQAAILANRAWLRRHDLEADDAGHDHGDECKPQRLGGLTEQEHAEQHCSDSANAGPDGICSADRQHADGIDRAIRCSPPSRPRVAIVGTRRVNPSVYLRPIAQPISRPPARIRTSHAMPHLHRHDEAVPASVVHAGREAVLAQAQIGVVLTSSQVRRPSLALSA